MKSIIAIVIIVTSFGNVWSQENATRHYQAFLLKIMTYNIKFASPTFKPSWDERKKMQVEMIQQYKPDVIGIQEGLKKQVDYLMYNLKDYVVIGEGRKGGDDDEHLAILYKRDKLRLREMGSFQLSKTPEIIGSGPAINPRMVTWARFAYINIDPEENPYPEDYRAHWAGTKEFYVFNTHYFNGSKDSLARESASKLIRERIKELDRFGEWEDEKPIFLLGDFNCKPNSKPYNILVNNNPSNVYSPFKNTQVDIDKIDWILYKGNVSVEKYEVVEFQRNGYFPSDHKPIYAEFNLIADEKK